MHKIYKIKFKIKKYKLIYILTIVNSLLKLLTNLGLG